MDSLLVPLSWNHGVMRSFVGNIIRQSSTLVHSRCSPKEVSASKIRRSFLEYFCEDNKHLYVASSPVWSVRDPTLAFVNAGMNQFKDVFLGAMEPASRRIANSQKCIRIGGKHNDLSQVGLDGTHHTFFEMLGNWSFGDYFKKEACALSWDLLTKVYDLPPDRLYVTYFKGDGSLGLDPDIEVRDIWREIGVEDSHILPFGAKDNFWEMGVTGPCGPCTEIHFDHCPGRTNAGSLVNSGRSDLTELWNLVFTEYNRKADGSMDKLENHFVDTGMGFERLVAILQGKTSNYDTDLFYPLFEAIKKYTGHTGYTGQYDGNAIDCAYRTIADHSRMIAVSLSDGMIPNHQNKVRGVFRKAVGLAEKMFRTDCGLMKELSNHVAESLSDSYPEIGKNLPKIHYIIESEGEQIKAVKDKAVSQWKTLEKHFPFIEEADILETPQLIEGLSFIKKNILERRKKEITEENAFELFQTYGLPSQVTGRLALNLGLAFDVSSFEKYELGIKKSNRKAFQSSKVSDEILSPEVLIKLKEMGVKQTTDYFKHEYKVNGSGKYVFVRQPASILGIVSGNEILDRISSADVQDNKQVALILDRTQLFSEDVVQESDSGTFQVENQVVFNIDKVVKVKGLSFHLGSFKDFPRDASVAVHNVGLIKINENKRLKIMRNHTALHLLNAALRDQFMVVGEKVTKATAEKLSLTFMVYRDRIDTESLKKMEKFVKNFIKHGVSVRRRPLNHHQFQKLDSVVFIPGEFIVEPEIPVIEINSGFHLSRECCTGTHILNTGDIKDFVITKFKKGSYNLPKIEAMTGEEAVKIREVDSKMEDEWRCLETEISQWDRGDISKRNELLQKLKKLYSQVENGSGLSYIVRSKLMTRLDDARKQLKVSGQKGVK